MSHHTIIMSKYQNSKIYKLVSPSGLVYIGSTTSRLSQRKSKHKNAFKRHLEHKQSFVTAFKLFEEDIDNIQIELIEMISCNTKKELLDREAYYIKTITCVNKSIPGRTQKQYLIDNRDAIREKKNKVHECPCGRTYTYSHRARHFKSKHHVQKCANENLTSKNEP